MPHGTEQQGGSHAPRDVMSHHVMSHHIISTRSLRRPKGDGTHD